MMKHFNDTLVSFVREGISGVALTAVSVGIAGTAFVMKTSGVDDHPIAVANASVAPGAESPAIMVSLTDLMGAIGTVGTGLGGALTWYLTRRTQKIAADLEVKRACRDFEREEREHQRAERQAARAERLEALLVAMKIQHSLTAARVEELAAGASPLIPPAPPESPDQPA